MKKSYTKKHVDKIRKKIKHLSTDGWADDITEDDLRIIEIYWIGVADGFNQVRDSALATAIRKSKLPSDGQGG